MTRSDVDTKSAIEQVEENATEIYEMVLTDLSNYEDPENKEMIEITLMANDQYDHMDESASAEEWLNDYNTGRIEPDWVSGFIDEERREEDEEDEESETEELNLISDADDLTPEQLEVRLNELASKVKEISRRSYYHEEGFMCGPAANTSVVAEIAVEVNDKNVYLTGYWSDIVDAYDFIVTKESLYDCYEAMDSVDNADMQFVFADEINRISSERMREHTIVFKPFFAELKQMIHDEMKAHGLEYFYEDQAEEDDEILM